MSTTGEVGGMGDGLGGVRGSMRSPDDAEGIDAEFLGDGMGAGRGVRAVCSHQSTQLETLGMRRSYALVAGGWHVRGLNVLG